MSLNYLSASARPASTTYQFRNYLSFAQVGTKCMIVHEGWYTVLTTWQVPHLSLHPRPHCWFDARSVRSERLIDQMTYLMLFVSQSTFRLNVWATVYLWSRNIWYSERYTKLWSYWPGQGWHSGVWPWPGPTSGHPSTQYEAVCYKTGWIVLGGWWSVHITLWTLSYASQERRADISQPASDLDIYPLVGTSFTVVIQS